MLGELLVQQLEQMAADLSQRPGLKRACSCKPEPLALVGTKEMMQPLSNPPACHLFGRGSFGRGPSRVASGTASRSRSTRRLAPTAASSPAAASAQELRTATTQVPERAAVGIGSVLGRMAQRAAIGIATGAGAPPGAREDLGRRPVPAGRGPPAAARKDKGSRAGSRPTEGQTIRGD